ncbi:fumarylacetoacetate hydrolase family protein [Methylobacterium sp. NEAU 140]|uniref:2-keto-4-pentenoate hydratase n=1 Tax=Methylobacterium sp. NEAU 140 TaxID=3064945 RepID=UPI002736FD7E|nr:fumarylacetoacetate hydrolase family protein [Methylobacterium sp. NEAU 140]MDP4024337.1 fumarylacetoacetate hydrolase family protein [Methylobacterium sp. NEAU 140]
MDQAHAQEASDLLVRHWRDGTTLDALPGPLRPADRAAGYRIQAGVAALSREPLFGWKIAATSEAGQRHIAVDGPLAGRLIAEMVHPDGAALPLGGNRMRVAEAEFAFRMGRDLPPRPEPYDRAAVLDAVAGLHLAIEVPDSRFTDFTVAGAAQLIADNACAHMFVLGPEAPASWRDLDLAAHRVVARFGGDRVREGLVREGLGANVLGDPRDALTWLANELSRHGLTLGRGQVVTTGTCLIPLEIAPGDRVSVDFGGLGRVGAHFT